MIRLSRRTVLLIILMVLSSIGILLIALMFVPMRSPSMRSPSPADLFQRIVIHPIPDSVQAIEADVCHQSSLKDRLTGWRHHEYLLRFDISKEDISNVLTSGSFRELGFVGYNSGVLVLGVTNRDAGHFVLYETEEEEPAWFDLEQWKDTKAWIAEEERKGSWYKAHVVLYSEHLGRAYFLEYETTGEWTGGTQRIITSETGTDIPESVQRQLRQAAMERAPESFRKTWEEAERIEEETQQKTREWVRQMEEMRQKGTYSEANAPPIPRSANSIKE